MTSNPRFPVVGIGASAGGVEALEGLLRASSNEELVSLNEETQSTNEELEASKEELQALSEELQTVNAELKGKIDALDLANDDLTNLFESTGVATLFLDTDLVIRIVTPAAAVLFNIRDSDRGRPLTELASRIGLPTLAADVAIVCATGTVIERAVAIGDDGSAPRQSFLLRIIPYRSGAASMTGVVLTFVDVTSLAEAERHLRTMVAELNHRVKNMLAVVIGVANQTFGSSNDASIVKQRLIARIQSMTTSYELLSANQWTGAGLAELVRAQLAPFDPDRFDVGGTIVTVAPNTTLSLGMILHELATNAARHGALSTDGGRVGIHWQRTSNGTILAWRETGGTPATAPTRPGFGLRLVERQTSYDLHGKADIRFTPAGLEVDLAFPDDSEVTGHGRG